MRCPLRSDETRRYRVTDYAFAYHHVYDRYNPNLNPKPWTTSRVMRDKVIKSSYGSGPSARGSRVLLLDAYNPWAGGFPGPGGIPHGDPTCNVGLTDGAVQRFNVFDVEEEVIRNGDADHTARLYDLWGRGTLYLINREMGYLR